MRLVKTYDRLHRHVRAWADEGTSRVAPGNCCLAGPPGTGKDLLVRHVGARHGMPVYFVNCGTEQTRTWAGEGARNMRRIAERAKQDAPSILYFAELEAIGRERSRIELDSGNALELWNTQTAMYSIVDDLLPSDGVLLLAATNMLDYLDPAVRRRFPITLEIGLPSHDERIRLLRQCLDRNDTSMLESAVKRVAGETDGLPHSLVCEIAIAAQRDAVVRGDCAPTAEDLLQACRLMMGGHGRPRMGFAPREK